MFHWFGKILFCVVISLVLNCGKKNSHQTSPEIAGPVTAVTGYDGVVSIGGGALCTGTIIGKRAVLTAHHCVHKTTAVTVRLPAGTFKPIKVEALGGGGLGDPNDVAVLIFDEDVAAPAVLISVKSGVDANAEVTIVGFGCNDFGARKGQGTKRAGTNRLKAAGEFLEITTPIRKDSKEILGPKNYAGSCFGDSGGPMFQDGAVIGINHSAGEDEREHLSRYINLTDSKNIEFLKRINDSNRLDIQFKP